jgi:preprotein translocase subunit Sss1
MRPPGPLEIGLILLILLIFGGIGLVIFVLVHFIRKHW